MFLKDSFYLSCVGNAELRHVELIQTEPSPLDVSECMDWHIENGKLMGIWLPSCPTWREAVEPEDLGSSQGEGKKSWV